MATRAPKAQCARVQRLLSEYIDGDLEAPERRILLRHLGRCAPCANLERELTALVDALRRLGSSRGACALVALALPPRAGR